MTTPRLHSPLLPLLRALPALVTRRHIDLARVSSTGCR